MSGRMTRTFLNNLLKDYTGTYLEIGVWKGSTFLSACAGNTTMRQAIAMDNWSEFGGPKSQFMDNVASMPTKPDTISVIEANYKTFDYSTIDLSDAHVYFFDGPHEEIDQYEAIWLLKDKLPDSLIFMVDDWNWSQVRTGTFNGIRDAGYSIKNSIEIRTSFMKDSEYSSPTFGQKTWHNGFFIGELVRGTVDRESEPVSITYNDLAAMLMKHRS